MNPDKILFDVTNYGLNLEFEKVYFGNLFKILNVKWEFYEKLRIQQLRGLIYLFS